MATRPLFLLALVAAGAPPVLCLQGRLGGSAGNASMPAEPIDMEAVDWRPAEIVNWSQHFVPLYPEGMIPGRRTSDLEKYLEADTDSNDIARSCAPGDNYGHWFFDVSVPAVRPFLVERSQPHRTDVSVLVIPGGGCEFLAWTKEGVEVAQWLNTLGISAFILKHRVPCMEPDGPRPGQGQYADAQRAMKLLRFHAHDLKLNPAKIGIIGFSQGGEIGSFVAAGGYDRYVQTIDVVDQENSKPDFFMAIYPAFNGEINPKDLPVTYIAISDNDPCADALQAASFYERRHQIDEARTEGGVMFPKTELHVFADGRHGFGLCRMYPETDYGACGWPASARRFIEAEVIHNGKYPTNPEAAKLRRRDREYPPPLSEE